MSDLADRSGLPGEVVGLGSDLTDVGQLRAALGRRPGLRRRLFTEREWEHSARHRDPMPHLAARFAAKEAVMKCLGQGIGRIGFTDIEVVRTDDGPPALELSGRARLRADELSVDRWMLTMTHTTSLAQAVALAVGRPS